VRRVDVEPERRDRAPELARADGGRPQLADGPPRGAAEVQPLGDMEPGQRERPEQRAGPEARADREAIVGRGHGVLGFEAPQLVDRAARIALGDEQPMPTGRGERVVLDADRLQHERALAAGAGALRAVHLDERGDGGLAGAVAQAFRHCSRYSRYSSTRSFAGGLQVVRPLFS
jgi:hypothetical protein